MVEGLERIKSQDEEENNAFRERICAGRKFCKGENKAMDYLLKTEPTEYSYAELQRDEETTWDGVTNSTAVMHLRGMKAGDRLVIYETGNVKSAVGTAEVVSVDASDPKKPVVKIKAGPALVKRVSLEEIKKNRQFKDSPLVKMGRLSVVPLTPVQHQALLEWK